MLLGNHSKCSKSHQYREHKGGEKKSLPFKAAAVFQVKLGMGRIETGGHLNPNIKPLNSDSLDQLGTTVPLLFSPSYSQFSFPPQQDPKGLQELKGT